MKIKRHKKPEPQVTDASILIKDVAEAMLVINEKAVPTTLKRILFRKEDFKRGERHKLDILDMTRDENGKVEAHLVVRATKSLLYVILRTDEDPKVYGRASSFDIYNRLLNNYPYVEDAAGAVSLAVRALASYVLDTTKLYENFNGIIATTLRDLNENNLPLNSFKFYPDLHAYVKNRFNHLPMKNAYVRPEYRSIINIEKPKDTITDNDDNTTIDIVDNEAEYTYEEVRDRYIEVMTHNIPMIHYLMMNGDNLPRMVKIKEDKTFILGSFMNYALEDINISETPVAYVFSMIFYTDKTTKFGPRIELFYLFSKLNSTSDLSINVLDSEGDITMSILDGSNSSKTTLFGDNLPIEGLKFKGEAKDINDLISLSSALITQIYKRYTQVSSNMDDISNNITTLARLMEINDRKTYNSSIYVMGTAYNVSIRADCTLFAKPTLKITIFSDDLNTSIRIENFTEDDIHYDKKGLTIAVYQGEMDYTVYKGKLLKLSDKTERFLLKIDMLVNMITSICESSPKFGSNKGDDNE